VTIEQPFKVAFEQRPCTCVKYHCPQPLVSELHHIFPQADQLRLLGRVNDTRVQPLCGSGHANVHAYLDWLLGKRAIRPDVGPAIRACAQLGYERIIAAGHAVRSTG